MAGCQAIKQNGSHCRNYVRKGLTCCRVHHYLENMVAEIEIPRKEYIEIYSPLNPTYSPCIYFTCEEEILYHELNKLLI